ncbi:hypothetical protein SKAU_G00264380 [Synaphobranchus kaupii]|uniref:APC membrane recruitment protein 2 n=1 Tax=Synaphobranchus kaupii TaxID=118154 RepID=A0A9Q1IQ05_SYNKA|nr:hypothetical protein SKAU_G00264380 [Synaphobranchus kaupii]
MDLQSENDPQPSGKINKAAFKLFGKRKPGSPVSSIFSIRSKGEGGKGAAKAPLVRSNTHDGIMETTAELEEARRRSRQRKTSPTQSTRPSQRYPRAPPSPPSLRGRGEEQEEPPPPALLLASRSNSVEIVKEHMTLTPRPPPRAVDAQTPPTPEADEDASIPATLDDGSPLLAMAGDQWNKIFFPYSALAPKEMPTLATADTTEARDKGEQF